MRWYRHSNKRLVPRGQGGRFRRTTLEDVGVGMCEECGAAFCLSDHEADVLHIDPRLFNRMKKCCPKCLAMEVPHE